MLQMPSLHMVFHPRSQHDPYVQLPNHRTICTFSQGPLFPYLLVALHLVSHLEVRKLFEGETTLGALAHLGDVFLLVLEGRQASCVMCQLVWSQL